MCTMHLHRKSWAFCDPGETLIGYGVKDIVADRFSLCCEPQNGSAHHRAQASVALWFIPVLQHRMNRRNHIVT